MVVAESNFHNSLTMKILIFPAQINTLFRDSHGFVSFVIAYPCPQIITIINA